MAYVELYAAKAQRRAAILDKKGFECTCERCTALPAHDALLDGWQCAQCGPRDASGAVRPRTSPQEPSAAALEVGSAPQNLGVVPPGALSCDGCGTRHALSPRERAARESSWQEAIQRGKAWAGGGQAATQPGTSDGHISGDGAAGAKASRNGE